MTGSYYADRLGAFRNFLSTQGLTAFIVPTTDPHQSEYVATHWGSRAWISGFTGSAGTAVITTDQALLWTDSRYFLQAESELKASGFTLQKQGKPGTKPHPDWLAANLEKGARVGIDGRLISATDAEKLRKTLKKRGIELVLDLDPFPSIWNDRPALPTTPIFAYSELLAGASFAEKAEQIRTSMAEEGATHLLLTALDEIAWLFNLRGSDVDFCPVFYAYAILGATEATLFIDPVKAPEALREDLIEAGVTLKNYDDIRESLYGLEGENQVLFDPERTAALLAGLIAEENQLEGESPVRWAKGIKNQVEIDHLRDAMIKDGTALLRLFRWLEGCLEEGTKVAESEVATKLAGFRAEQEGYVSESFPAIVGYGPNGAIVHYRPEAGKDLEIKAEGLLLLDSGGQYLDGTTDITRTVALGEPTFDQILHYTTVLKGHIALAKAAFPKGTKGYQLDVLARAPLWEEALDFGHGTGHGVGFFLNVHEGPQGIRSTATGAGAVAFEPGMVTSNEPGFYLAGEYGIRIENLILCEAFTESDFGEYYCFEDLTLFPMDFELVEYSMLGPDEIDWLGIYHLTVLTELEPLLTDDEMEWLTRRCMPFIQIHEAHINQELEEIDLDDPGFEDDEWQD